MRVFRIKSLHAELLDVEFPTCTTIWNLFHVACFTVPGALMIFKFAHMLEPETLSRGRLFISPRTERLLCTSSLACVSHPLSGAPSSDMHFWSCVSGSCGGDLGRCERGGKRSFVYAQYGNDMMIFSWRPSERLCPGDSFDANTL